MHPLHPSTLNLRLIGQIVKPPNTPEAYVMPLPTIPLAADAEHSTRHTATPDQRAALLDHAATAKAAGIGAGGWAALAQVPEEVLRALSHDDAFMAEVERRVMTARAEGSDLVHAARAGLRVAIEAAQAALNDPGTTPVELASLTRSLSGIVQSAEMLADRKDARTDEGGERLPVFNFVFQHGGMQADLVSSGAALPLLDARPGADPLDTH